MNLLVCLYVCFLSSDAAGTKDIQKSLLKGARVRKAYCMALCLEEKGPDLKE